MVKTTDSLLLREVEIADENLLLNWANEHETRRWSFNSSIILPMEHKKWFSNNLENKNVLMWILEYDHTPAGLVRLEKDNNEVVLNYMIAFHSRGKGLASKMLKMAMNEIKNYWQNVKLLAYTLPENIASIESLKKAGFTLENSSDEKNCYVFHITESMSTTGE